LSTNTDNGRIDRTVLQAGGHAGRAAADDEDRLPESGVDRVDRHEIVAFGFALGSMGRAMSSLLLTRRGSLRVATTVPTTFARIMVSSQFSVFSFQLSLMTED
jgi:hypothetical protein